MTTAIPATGARPEAGLLDASGVATRLAEIARSMPGNASIRQLGTSRRGQPILMLTIGDGARSALAIGGAHANEPIGSLSACRLAERLARGTAPATALAYRWHVVGTIDPDGLMMNDGWLRGDGSPASYFHAFFRPAFERQPGYSFPLTAGSYRFDAPTPENLAWQRALDIARPDLHVDLHGAEYGGVFYLDDRDLPGLADALAALPARHGLTLNPFGEPFSDMAARAPGLFAFIDVAALARSGSPMWRAGDSSARFSALRHGSFNFVCEAPFWDDDRLRDASISPFSLIDVVRRHRARLDRLSAIALPLFAALPLDPSPDAVDLRASLEEVARLTPIQIAFADRLIAGAGSAAPLPVKDFAIHDTVLALTALRAWAMLARLARLLSARHPAVMPQAVRSAAERDAGLRTLNRESRLRPVPAAEASALQVDAVFAVTEALARTG